MALRMKARFLLACAGIILLPALIAQAQSPVAVSSSASSANSNSTSVSSAASSSKASNTNNVTMSAPQQLVASQAGASGVAGPIPGFAPLPGSCNVVWSEAEHTFTLGELRSMVSGLKWNKKHMDISVRKRASKDDADDDDDETLTLVHYDVRYVANKGDKVLADLVVPGEYHQAEGKPLALALLKAYEQTGAKRYSVMGCADGKSVTKGQQLGFGVTSSGMTAAGNIGTSGSFGFNSGKSTSGIENYQVLLVRALNHNGGLIEPPAESDSTPGAGAQPLPLQASQSAQLQQQPSAPGQQQTTTSLADTCPIQALTIYFEFNSSQINDEYLPQIKAMAGWLKDHPSCKVQVQGHASREGTTDYNVVLGDRRSDHVLAQLKEDGAPTEELESASLGKRFPKGEYEKENRRVILVVQGPASGK